MSTLWQGKRARRVSFDAAALCLSLALSYLEVLTPLLSFLPLPGVKLGLANMVVTALFFMISPADAAVVSALRILLSALLFGSPVSLLFAAMGGAAAYLSLWVTRLARRRMSYIGVSVIGAAAHHTGQIAAACILFGSGVITAYLPILLVAGVLTGVITGGLLNAVSGRLEKAWKGGLKA